MKTKLHLFIPLTVIFIGMKTTNAQCADPVNIYSFVYNNKSYEIVKEKKDWTTAAACAVERGGYLAEINDVNEQDAIYLELSTNASIDISNTVSTDGGSASYVWIGGSDSQTEGVWIWDGNDDSVGPQFWAGDVNGSPVDGLYNNWGTEPDNAGNQDKLALALTEWPINLGSLGSAGQWNDLRDNPFINSLYSIIEYDVNLGVNDHELKNNLKIYPNPVNHSFNIDNKNSSKLERLTILNTLGQTIKIIHKKFTDSIDISELNQGIYFAKIEFSNGQWTTLRLIKR